MKIYWSVNNPGRWFLGCEDSRVVVRAVDEAVEKAADRAVEKAIDEAVEKAADRAIQKVVDEAVERAIQ
ncbi:hypothetical protein MTR67_027051 [Solanum verrucosum]|uniref:Uncharacterized protein n=1 Tax=Solanum verrucosum TaxID=315347 RepID=A0AAF0TV15_SOLVR|nr:hypothetical protein MTR67_027051 [Solanum verrucosum]